LSPGRPSKIRVGDIDADGYPDLLMTVYPGATANPRSGTAVLLKCLGLVNGLPVYGYS